MPARGTWLTLPDGRHCAGWVSEPDRPDGRSALLLPPIGYEYSSSHRFLRTVAERLAAGGIRALRLDYPGTGDSEGAVEDIADLGPWRAAVTGAAEWLRATAPGPLSVVGVQLGATLAALETDALDPAAFVAVAPVTSGRRFLRGLRVLGEAAPDGAPPGLQVGGTFFPAALLDALGATVVDLPDHTDVVGSGGAVAAFLGRPAEYAEVAPALVDDVAAHASAPPASAAPATTGLHPVLVDTAVLGASGVTERFRSVGDRGLAAVETSGATSDGATVLLVNSGSDPHTGPGRAWVGLARRLADDGVTTVRVDLRGWGESPDGPNGPGAPGRPYDAHGIDDLLDALAALRTEGRRPIVVGGLCAGAWIALAAARTGAVDAVLALNPQLYWQPGDPVEATMDETRTRRRPEIEHIRAAAATGRWDSEDAEGLRPPAGQWLDDLVATGRPVTLVFAPGDDGLEYLRDRLGRRLDAAVGSGVVQVEQLPAGVDHGLQRTWLRPAAFDRLAGALHRLHRTEPADRAGAPR